MMIEGKVGIFWSRIVTVINMLANLPSKYMHGPAVFSSICLLKVCDQCTSLRKNKITTVDHSCC